MSKLPSHIREMALVWADIIKNDGILEMRRVPGYHDEPLKGDRRGQRSSRLNRAYRVIYTEDEKGEVIIISVLEVNKHDY